MTMNSAVKKQKPVVVLNPDEDLSRRVQGRGVVLCQGPEDIVKAMNEVTHRSFWISLKRALTDDLLRSARQCQHRRGRIYGLLTLEAPRPKSVPGLSGHFRRLVGTAPDSAFLPLEELLEVLAAPTREAADLFIAGVADAKSETLALTRGNLRTITAPFSMFEPSGTGVRPDFRRLSLTDYGHTVRLGEYEASSDAILYEIAPDYRRKLRKRRLAQEKTFGASLRRLRIQRKLARNDFPPLSAKTIARLERDEIRKPHGDTLRTIAQRLGVEPEEIEIH
jgi:hypothetical protein